MHNSELSQTESPNDQPLEPPPLPPRRKTHRENEEGLSRLDNAPEIPPRGMPPRVPPRSNSMIGTLPRCVSQQPTRHSSGHSQNLHATLPRCNDRESRPSLPINLNGDDSIPLTITPKLPPKTYKHIRQQSS